MRAPMAPGLRRELAALTIDPMKSWTAILHNQIRMLKGGISARGWLKISAGFGQGIVSIRWFAAVYNAVGRIFAGPGGDAVYPVC